MYNSKQTGNEGNIVMKANKPLTIRLWLPALLLLFLVGCGVDSQVNELLNPAEPSKSPVAVIQASDTSVKVGSTITFKGNASTDPQSQDLTYAWLLSELPTGSASALSSATDAVVTLTLDVGGYYTVTLQVTNSGALKSNTAAVQVDATGTGSNHPPVAMAGADQSVTAGDLVILDASSSVDADQEDLTYIWTLLSAPATSEITGLSNASDIYSFLQTDVAGAYTVRLRVSDGIDTDEDFIIITAA